MSKLPSKREQDSVAALWHQTGPSKGSVSWLKGSTMDVFLSPGRLVRVDEAHPGEMRDGVIARLHSAAGSFEIEALDQGTVLVNRKAITTKKLSMGT